MALPPETLRPSGGTPPDEAEKERDPQADDPALSPLPGEEGPDPVERAIEGEGISVGRDATQLFPRQG